MSPRKTKDAARRIARILRERGSALAEQVEGAADVAALPRPTRERVVDELTAEFAARGLRDDGEPGPYGLELEDLTDACGLARDDEADEVSR